MTTSTSKLCSSTPQLMVQQHLWRHRCIKATGWHNLTSSTSLASTSSKSAADNVVLAERGVSTIGIQHDIWGSSCSHQKEQQQGPASVVNSDHHIIQSAVVFVHHQQTTSEAIWNPFVQQKQSQQGLGPLISEVAAYRGLARSKTQELIDSPNLLK